MPYLKRQTERRRVERPRHWFGYGLPEAAAGRKDRRVQREGEDAFHCPAPQGQAFISPSNGASQCPVSPAEKGRSDRVGNWETQTGQVVPPKWGVLMITHGEAQRARTSCAPKLRATGLCAGDCL